VGREERISVIVARGKVQSNWKEGETSENCSLSIDVESLPTLPHALGSADAVEMQEERECVEEQS